MFSESCCQFSVSFSNILKSAVWLQTSDAVDGIGGVTVHNCIDVNGEVGVGGGDGLASLDVWTVDTPATLLHARQHSLLSGGGRRNLGTNDKLSDILLSPVGYERRKWEDLTENWILNHYSPVFLHDLVGRWKPGIVR